LLLDEMELSHPIHVYPLLLGSPSDISGPHSHKRDDRRRNRLGQENQDHAHSDSPEDRTEITSLRTDSNESINNPDSDESQSNKGALQKLLPLLVQLIC
jgi:hypothetical protein